MPVVTASLTRPRPNHNRLTTEWERSTPALPQGTCKDLNVSFGRASRGSQLSGFLDRVFSLICNAGNPEFLPCGVPRDSKTGAHRAQQVGTRERARARAS